MTFYVIKRILLILPTLFGALFLNFCLLKTLPGSSSDYLTAKMYGLTNSELTVSNNSFDHEVVILRNQVPLNKTSSFLEEFFTFVRHTASFDFGKSFSKGVSVKALIMEKLPLSLALSFFALVFSYAFSIVIGLQKARKIGTWFDKLTTGIFITIEAIPSFLLSIIFIIFFAGGFYWQWFPMAGLPAYDAFFVPWYRVIFDYGYYLFLPFLILVVQGLGQGVFFVKGAFLEETKKPYVQGVYARGGSEGTAFYHHMLPHVFFSLLSHLPTIFMGSFFMRTLVVEMVFSLDGFGLLFLQGVLERDYPLILGSFFLFIVIGLMLQLFIDLISLKLDPRIHFNRLGKT